MKILVFIQDIDNKINSISLEALVPAQKIKNETNGEVHAVLFNDSSLEECTETLELNEETWKLEKGEYKTVITNYTEKEQIGYNGPVYDVDVDEDFCFRLNSTDSWECEPDGTFQMTWALIDGKWSVAQQGLDEYGDGPTPSVSMFSSKTSEEIYYLEIIKVSRESALTNYNFFLKKFSIQRFI